ncbi:hypothetical protein EV384_6949 [Micromonospora kangleipakensis]|uniref:Uncharacterized protein n=1 Tax=Micromonospora kangleipakensis TaxID=1077942 RepID=A0A4Q8BJB7_9ACTN|nr:hypothetical protein [Micromonospora kangleipakensis]RZU78197.1 hypothetical protein EV384_6949 [Micromonospora kangleipakensis]
MAFRTWGRLLLTALGVSALAGAGQLGIAYGFGIVRLNGAFTDGSVNRWPAQLVWVAWFAAVAAVAGAVGTERLARRDGVPGGTTEQFSVAGAAALGAIVVAPLCMQPARAAEFGGTVDPVWAVGICAILGAVVGAGAALAVLPNPPLGWNIAMTGGLLWLLALVSVAPALASTGPLATARLGVLEPSWLDTATAQRLAMLLLPTVALLAGAAVGALARRRGHPPLVGGAAGAAGPALVAFAYLTAGPGDAADRYQLAPYYGALIAVAAGALGSTAATVLRRPAGVPATGAIEPTDILQPLPTGPAPAYAGAPLDRAEDGPATADRSHAGAPTTAAGGSTVDLDRYPAARDTAPAGAGRPIPAHWDWPVAPSGTPTPAPAGLARPATGRAARSDDDRGPATTPVPATTKDRDLATPSLVPADDRGPATPPVVPADDRGLTTPVTVSAADDRDLATPSVLSADDPGLAASVPVPAAEDDPGRLAGAPAPGAVARDRTVGPPAVIGAGGAGPVIERDADDPAQSLPAPTPLSSARRISAIDVVAAGRTSAPQATRPAAGIVPPAPATPTPGTATPAAWTEAAAPTFGHAANAPSTQAAAPAPSARTATTAPPAKTTTTAPSAGTATPTADVAAPGPGVPAPAATRRGGAATPDVEVSARTPETDAPRRGAETPDGAALTGLAGMAADAPASRSGSAAGSGSASPAPSTGRPKRARKARAAASGSAEPTPTSATDLPPAAAAGEPRTPGRSTAGKEATTAGEPRTAGRSTTGKEATAAAQSRTAGRSTVDDEATAADRAETAGPSGATGWAGGAPGSATGTGRSGGSVPTSPPAGPAHLSPATPDDAPAEAEHGFSPRPRIPIFEDADRRGDVRPAWPIAPAPVWPATPRQAAAPTGSTTDAADDEANGTPVEPAPRPRHRALPDLDGAASWDALANARRAVGPNAVESAPADSPVPAHQADDPEREPDDQSPAAGGGGEEAGAGKSRPRRGLFRRNRAKGGEERTTERNTRESEPVPAHDEEYVDWVSGLGRPAAESDSGSLRTGRHHRD